jgi:hypothetical protein
LIKTSFRDAGDGLATPFANLHPTSQDNLSLGIPKERGREGGHVTPGAEIWMQTPSRWAKRGDSWRDSPRTETPGESWSAAYVPDGTTGGGEVRYSYAQVKFEN